MDATSPKTDERELRCSCGNLMARVTDAGVELKCRRCKRLVVVPVRPDGEWVEVTLR